MDEVKYVKFDLGKDLAGQLIAFLREKAIKIPYNNEAPIEQKIFELCLRVRSYTEKSDNECILFVDDRTYNEFCKLTFASISKVMPIKELLIQSGLIKSIVLYRMQGQGIFLIAEDCFELTLSVFNEKGMVQSFQEKKGK